MHLTPRASDPVPPSVNPTPTPQHHFAMGGPGAPGPDTPGCGDYFDCDAHGSRLHTVPEWTLLIALAALVFYTLPGPCSEHVRRTYRHVAHWAWLGPVAATEAALDPRANPNWGYHSQERVSYFLLWPTFMFGIVWPAVYVGIVVTTFALAIGNYSGRPISLDDLNTFFILLLFNILCNKMWSPLFWGGALAAEHHAEQRLVEEMATKAKEKEGKKSRLEGTASSTSAHVTMVHDISYTDTGNIYDGMSHMVMLIGSVLVVLGAMFTAVWCLVIVSGVRYGWGQFVWIAYLVVLLYALVSTCYSVSYFWGIPMSGPIKNA